MMNRWLLVASLFVALGLARQASAAPAWCLADNPNKHDDHDWERAVKKDDPVWALYYLSNAVCGSDSDLDEHKDELEAARKYWNAELDMTEADWADVAYWQAVTQSMRYYTAPVSGPKPEKKAWSKYTPVEQYLVLADLRDERDYFVDALGPNLSELARMGYIEHCISTNENQEVTWAMCAGDIAAFDTKKLAAEIRSDKIADGYGRTIFRMKAWALKKKLADHAAAVKELIAKDEAFGKMFDIAANARKEWDSRASSRAALLELVAQMDDGRITSSRKALEGCDDKTQAAWAAAVGKIPAKSWEHMRTNPETAKRFIDQAIGPIINDPDAELASLALMMCAQANDRSDYVVDGLASSLAYWPGYRGPRSAALTAIVSAGLTFDDRDFKLRIPSVRHEWVKLKYSQSGGFGRGVLSQAKSDGKKIHVVFQAKLENQVQCAKSRTTNRLERIDSDGRLVYAEQCLQTKTVVVNKASDPQNVSTRYAAGVKPGAYVEIYGDVTAAVWDKASSAVPSVVMGVPVR